MFRFLVQEEESLPLVNRKLFYFSCLRGKTSPVKEERLVPAQEEHLVVAQEKDVSLSDANLC